MQYYMYKSIQIYFKKLILSFHMLSININKYFIILEYLILVRYYNVYSK